MKTPAKVLQQMVDAVAKHDGNVTATAISLGIPRGTLQDRMRQALQQGLKPSSKVEDPNNIHHVKHKLKRAEQEVNKLRENSFEEQQVRDILGLIGKKVQAVKPPKWVSAQPSTPSSPGIPTLFLSDLHWGEVVNPAQVNYVNKYNVAIAKARLHEVGERAIQLLKIISPKLDYPGIVIPLGGDCVSGNIHDELTATNELQSMPAMLDLYGELITFITHMANIFGCVFLPCVTGNHGRNTVKIWNKDRHATNYDWLLYKLLEKHFQNDKRVSFLIPEEPDAYYQVYDFKYLLTHGDQFRGGDSMIGCLGPIIRGDHKKRSRNGQINLSYDVMLLGHWHQYIHHSRVIVNGSLVGLSEYAYNNNFGFEDPQQALWINHAKHKITFRMPIHLEDKTPTTTRKWVSVQQ